MAHTPASPSRRAERGLTLIEVVMSVAAVSLVVGGAMTVMLSSRGAYEVGGNQSSLQEVGRRVVDQILSDVRRSGMTEIGAQSYPAIWQRPILPTDASERGALFATMDYEDEDLVDQTLAYEGTGSNRIERNADRETNELTFQIPGDVDGDGWPIDANGEMEWLPQVVCYRVEEAANGVPWLVRVVEEAGAEVDRERVAPWVQNLTFDVVYNDRSLGFGTIAVVVYLERRNARGQTIRAALEGSVVLRNTREL